MRSQKHINEIFYGGEFLSYVKDQTLIKQTMIAISPIRYLMRAMMAGMIVLFGYVGYILLDSNFAQIAINGESTFQPLGHFFAGWFFGFCLIFIYYAKTELLTSNMMVFSVSVYYKNTTIVKMLKVLALCYLGNLLGGILVGLLLGKSTIITGSAPATDYMIHVLETKQNYGTSLGGVYDMFIRAVFCNFFINLAMLTIYSGNLKSDGSKMVAMFGGVFFFMYLGLEHSVANTVFFALAGFTDLFNPALEIGFDFGLAAFNIFIVFLGNMIGGGALIGIYYAFLNDKDRALKNDIKTN